MDVKTLSTIIGHTSAHTTLDIYSHITDTMQLQAAARIDKAIGKNEEALEEIEKVPLMVIKSLCSPNLKQKRANTGSPEQVV